MVDVRVYKLASRDVFVESGPSPIQPVLCAHLEIHAVIGDGAPGSLDVFPVSGGEGVVSKDGLSQIISYTSETARPLSQRNWRAQGSSWWL